MDKKEILEKQKYLFSCVATYYDEPLVVDHAKDQFVYDADGKEYLDFFGGILTVSVGHCNEKVTKAIDEQTHKLQHMSTLYANEPQVRSGGKAGADHSRTAGKIVFHQQRHGGQRNGRVAGADLYQVPGMITLRHSYSGRSLSRLEFIGAIELAADAQRRSRACITSPTPTATAARSA